MSDLPAYLRDGAPGGRTYGTLSYNRRAKCWTIKGEPCVTELAKRLFPGAEGRGRGEARFAAHRRLVGELNWLMLRYPLEIREADRARWEQALAGAREYAERLDALYKAPEYAEPPPSFSGTLLPFQKQGLSFLLAGRRALLADEMGLGKTVEALAFLAASGDLPALVVAPPHLTRNWAREIERFLRLEGGVRVHTIRGLNPYPLPPCDVAIIHYLLLRGWKKALPEIGFRAVIFDEIQELRRGGTEKYSAASLLAGAVDDVIGLSGTPIYNRGGEIWNVVNILDYHMLGSYDSFSREWCVGYGGDVVKDPALLGDFLRREGLMLRRTKADVLPELPPKRRLVQEIDWDDQLYRKFMEPVTARLRLLDDAPDASARALLEDAICQDERQATGVAKAPFVAAFVRALVESGERVLLFAHHHRVMDIYKKELKPFRPAFITGRENERDKQQSCDAFQSGSTDLCVISLRSASGLNLQRASCVVFGELDWSPAVHSQAEDRAHRIGQADSLLCYYLVSPRGSDQDVQQALGLKVSQFLGLMGDRPPDQDLARLGETDARSHMRRLVERLRRDAVT
ncbi:MAG: DEAD/DEAH box helicase [Clostridiales bacterium]|nr:DEAD/DEAH box helicase [Clostridiales bacterium]